MNDKKTEFEMSPKCPMCGYKIDESEDLGPANLITYHGEDGAQPYECPRCESKLAITESVTRDYDTLLVEKYYVVQIINKDGKKRIFEECHTDYKREYAENKMNNHQRFIKQCQEMNPDKTNLWYHQIEKMEILEIITDEI